MKYLLDSNTIIAAMLGTSDALRARMAACDADDMVTSAIVYAEVAHGSHHGKPPPKPVLDAFLQDIPVLPFDDAAARAYARLPFQRARYDRLIGAHALSLGLGVVTANERDYIDIHGLTVENWMRV